MKERYAAITVGSRWALAWKHPHRIEATIVAFEQDVLIAEVDHRCPITCYLQQMRTTLPLHGMVRYTYREFAKMFVPMVEDAIALSG